MQDNISKKRPAKNHALASGEYEKITACTLTLGPGISFTQELKTLAF